MNLQVRNGTVALQAMPGPRTDRTRCQRLLTVVLIGFLAGAWHPSAVAQSAAGSAVLLKKLSIDELLDIEVTSVSKRAEKLSETASSIQVITQDEIRRSGASSLPEALRLAPNLEVAQIDSRQWAISARGFANSTANKLLVLIDGRTVYTPLYAGVFWDAQDTTLEDIERIEVISGPGATLWGSNAVNGVINITTKRARDTQGGLLSVGGGNELRKFGGLRYGDTLGANVKYRVYAKYFDRDGTAFPNGVDVANGWHMAQGGFAIDDELSSRDATTLQGDVYRGRIEQQTLDAIETSGSNLLGRWTRTLSATANFQLQTYIDRTHRRIPGSITEDLDTYNVDWQHQFAPTANQDMVWGLNYRYIDDTIVNPVTLGFLPPHVTQQWYSAFLQDEIALYRDALHLTLGTKFEHNDYTGFEFQPSVRLAWRLDERNTLWSAVSRAVRTPSRVDGQLYAPSSPPFTLLVGNPGFQSEKLIAYELGYRGQANQRLSWSLSTYYNHYTDLRSVEHVNPPAPFPIMLGNGLKAHSYGAELSADYQVMDAWRMHVGYTEMRLHFRHEPGSTDTNPGSSEAQDPEQQWSLRSSFELPHHTQLDATFRHVSTIANQQVPAYGELDLHLAWLPLPTLELSITGRNLLHAQHAEFGAAATRTEIERSVYGKASWQF